ncbi:MAG: hypothetical protein ACPGUD_00270 [Parashewanella sp.]
MTYGSIQIQATSSQISSEGISEQPRASNNAFGRKLIRQVSNSESPIHRFFSEICWECGDKTCGYCIGDRYFAIPRPPESFQQELDKEQYACYHCFLSFIKVLGGLSYSMCIEMCRKPAPYDPFK